MRIEKKKLQNILSSTKKALVKTISEIGEGVQILVTNNELLISASSVFMSITGHTKVEPCSDMLCIVNAEQLYNTLNRINSDYVELNVDDSSLIVSGMNFSVNLPLLDDSMSNIKVVAKPDNYCETSHLKEYIKKCAHSLGDGKSDFKLGSFYIQLGENDDLKVTALDGRRISIRMNDENMNDDKYKTIGDYIVHGKQLKTAMDIISEDVKIGKYDDNNIFISGKNEDGEFNIIVSLVAGVFFNIVSTINSIQKDVIIKVDKNELINAINVAALFGHPILSITKNSITIVSKKEGRANITIPCKSNCDDKIKRCLNAQYAIDALSSLEGDEVTIEMANVLSPISMFSINGEKEIVMPIKIS